jgi:hypothetical protein
MSNHERRCRLAARLYDHHKVSLPRILSELDYLRETGDRVLAGGSLAYGLGNKFSDFDLIILGHNQEHVSRIPLEHFVSSLRVDVWRLSFEAVETMRKRAKEALESDAPLQGLFGDADDDFDLKLLSHTAFGINLDGAELVDQGCGEVVSRLVTREFLERMRTSALLAQLALRIGSSVSAVAHARSVVEEALIATLANRHLPFCGEKWLRDRVSDHPDLVNLYQPFFELPRVPNETAAKFVRQALGTSAHLWSLDLALGTLAPLGRWQQSDLKLMAVGTKYLLISRGSGAFWQLESGEVEAWRRLTADASDGGWSWSAASADDELLSFCASLYEMGLVDLRWKNGVQIKDLAPGREGVA